MKRRYRSACFATLLACLALWNLIPAFGPWESSYAAPPLLAEMLQSWTVNATGDSHRLDDVAHHRQPTHHACDGYDGVYHIAIADIEGGVGTALVQLIAVQIGYAERHNLLPWVHLNNQSKVIYDPIVHGGDGVRFRALGGRQATWIQGPHYRDFRPGPPNTSQPLVAQDCAFDGTGIWSHYFEPVSEFVPGDRSCESKPLINMDLYLITPGLHGYDSHAMRCWRYDYLPEYIAQVHMPYHEWLEPNRVRGHDVVSRRVHFRPYLVAWAEEVNPDCGRSQPCLGLHIRHSDKAAGRRRLPTRDFLAYAEAFVEAGGAAIYLATDSLLVVEEIQREWPKRLTSRLRTLSGIVRSSDQSAVFDIADHHRTNQEALVEILALSRCQFLVGGLSAVSEAAIWINLDLHNQSVNLEDEEHLKPDEFGRLVTMVSAGETADRWPHPSRVQKWWEAILPESPSKTIDHACDGFKGVLHIRCVRTDSSTAAAFFVDVLNQLVYAEKHNLKPWIHLEPETSPLVYDGDVHGNATGSLAALRVGVPQAGTEAPWHGFPFPGKPMVPESTAKPYMITGNGIWQRYFTPVFDLRSDDASCRDKTLVVLNSEMVSVGLTLHSPYTVRPWPYDNLPTHLNPTAKATQMEWIEQMRQNAHSLVSKYYRFQPFLTERASQVNPGNQTCLAVHIRVGDKYGRHRRIVKADKYVPYMEAFERAGGRFIYVATDSHRPLQYLQNNVPDSLWKLVHTQGKLVVRTTKDWPTHALNSHHRVNSETLVDILAMSRCHFLVHTASTTAEAAIYVNIDLHNNSVNLEDPNALSPQKFELLVSKTL